MSVIVVKYIEVNLLKISVYRVSKCVSNILYVLKIKVLKGVIVSG